MGLLERQQIRELVGKHSERLGVDPQVAFDNAMNFAERVGLMENDGKLQGQNPTSTAKGLYQFVDDSVDEAIKRTQKYIDIPWASALKNGATMNDLDKEQQTLLFLGDILEKTAVVEGKKIPGLGDDILKSVLSEGNIGAMSAAYSILHHTDPDEATFKRMEAYFND